MTINPKDLKPRIRTVEYESGWGWIARNPWTGKEVIDGFRWRTRSVARCVVDEGRLFGKPPLSDLTHADEVTE